MVSVVATIKVKPGSRGEFLERFLQLVPTVLAEEGCIEYFPAVDAETELDVQSKDADAVIVLEKWESVEALKAHLSADHMDDFRQQVAEIVTDLSVKILEPVK